MTFEQIPSGFSIESISANFKETNTYQLVINPSGFEACLTTDGSDNPHFTQFNPASTHDDMVDLPWKPKASKLLPLLEGTLFSQLDDCMRILMSLRGKTTGRWKIWHVGPKTVMPFRAPMGMGMCIFDLGRGNALAVTRNECRKTRLPNEFLYFTPETDFTIFNGSINQNATLLILEVFDADS